MTDFKTSQEYTDLVQFTMYNHEQILAIISSYVALVMYLTDKGLVDNEELSKLTEASIEETFKLHGQVVNQMLKTKEDATSQE